MWVPWQMKWKQAWHSPWDIFSSKFIQNYSIKEIKLIGPMHSSSSCCVILFDTPVMRPPPLTPEIIQTWDVLCQAANNSRKQVHTCPVDILAGLSPRPAEISPSSHLKASSGGKNKNHSLNLGVPLFCHFPVWDLRKWQNVRGEGWGNNRETWETLCLLLH